MDAEQRLAFDDLASLRLLSHARWRILWDQESMRAGSRSVLIRRQVDSCAQHDPPGLAKSEIDGEAIRYRSERTVFQSNQS